MRAKGETSVSLVPKDLTPVYKETIGKGAGARRWQRPVYVDHLPPCNHACPAGENIQAWLALAQAGDYERRLAEVHGGEPAAGHARPRVLSPLRKRLQPAIPRSGRLDPFARPVSRRSRQREGLDDRAGAAHRQARARRRRRPGGPVVRLPPAALRTRRRDPRRQPRAGRHDALRHSRLPPAARGARQGNRAHRGDGRDDRPQLARERRAGREGRGLVRRGVPRRSARRSRTTSTFRPWTAARSSTPSR